jgi:hypothetical protein
MDREASKYAMTEAPSELSGALPRKVGLNSSADAKYLLVVVLVFFVGGLLTIGWVFYHDVKQLQQRAALRVGGSEVVGEVTGVSLSRYTPMSVNYKFTVNEVTYSGEAEEPATPGPGTSFDKADKILIRFLPANPAINHPDAWEWSAAIGWSYTAFEIFLTTMGGLAFAFLWRDRRLAREGKAAVAVVTSCIRKDQTFRIEYEFCTGEGLQMKGRCDCVDEYGAGARVWILYLPQKPQRSHLYPLSLFEVLGG